MRSDSSFSVMENRWNYSLWTIVCYLNFFKNPNRILTREQIILKLWGYEYTGNDRAVDTHVKNVRKALGDYGSCIRTIVKKGYIFEANMIQ